MNSGECQTICVYCKDCHMARHHPRIDNPLPSLPLGPKGTFAHYAGCQPSGQHCAHHPNAFSPFSLPCANASLVSTLCASVRVRPRHSHTVQFLSRTDAQTGTVCTVRELAADTLHKQTSASERTVHTRINSSQSQSVNVVSSPRPPATAPQALSNRSRERASSQ